MKNLLLILLFLPLIGFGQCISGVCENGYGTYTYSGEWEGQKYVGEWKDGNCHGLGTMSFPSGSKYVGEHKDGKPHGQGTFTYANGRKYVGEFRNNLHDGEGTFTYEDGGKYVGEFRNNLRDGEGTMIWVNGGIYVGEWKEGHRHGQGTTYYKTASEYSNMPAGSRYEGQYVLSKANGYGKATYSDGTVEEGLWKDGEFIK